MTGNPVKLIATFLTMSVLMTACGHRREAQPVSRDAKLRRTMIGTWVVKDDGMMTFTSEGSFSSEWTNLHNKSAWTYEGNWEVTNGVCVTTVTKSRPWNTTNSEAVGSV